jgi:hypothetical protein
VTSPLRLTDRDVCFSAGAQAFTAGRTTGVTFARLVNGPAKRNDWATVDDHEAEPSVRRRSRRSGHGRVGRHDQQQNAWYSHLIGVFEHQPLGC